MRLLRVLFLVAALGLASFPASSGAATPDDARAFVDSIGVNTHLYYTDTAYGDFAKLRQRLLELGVRHIRDGFDPLRRQFFHERVNSLGAANIKSTLISCRIRPGNSWDDIDGMSSTPRTGSAPRSTRWRDPTSPS